MKINFIKVKNFLYGLERKFLDYKKFIYLVNDLTNLLLAKSRQECQEKYQRLLQFFYIAVVLLYISLLLNLYLYVSC
jgi:hypothetical protein